METNDKKLPHITRFWDLGFFFLHAAYILEQDNMKGLSFTARDTAKLNKILSMVFGPQEKKNTKKINPKNRILDEHDAFGINLFHENLCSIFKSNKQEFIKSYSERVIAIREYFLEEIPWSSEPFPNAYKEMALSKKTLHIQDESSDPLDSPARCADFSLGIYHGVSAKTISRTRKRFANPSFGVFEAAKSNDTSINFQKRIITKIEEEKIERKKRSLAITAAHTGPVI